MDVSAAISGISANFPEHRRDFPKAAECHGAFRYERDSTRETNPRERCKFAHFGASTAGGAVPLTAGRCLGEEEIRARETDPGAAGNKSLCGWGDDVGPASIPARYFEISATNAAHGAVRPLQNTTKLRQSGVCADDQRRAGQWLIHWPKPLASSREENAAFASGLSRWQVASFPWVRDRASRHRGALGAGAEVRDREDRGISHQARTRIWVSSTKRVITKSRIWHRVIPILRTAMVSIGGQVSW